MQSTISDKRTRLALTISQWVALAIAIFTTVFVNGPTPLVLGAAAIGGVYVLATTTAPVDLFRRPLVLDGAVVAGAILTMIAVTLTGSTASPYVLLALAPTLWAGYFGGPRPAFSTALLISAVTFLVEFSEPPVDLSGALLLTGVQLISAISVVQIRRLLGEMQRRSGEFEESQVTLSGRLRELENAHDLLAKLAEITAGGRTSPIALGTAAVDSIANRYPGAAASVTLAARHGPVLLATSGIPPEDAHAARFPLVVGSEEAGWIDVASPEPLSATAQSDIAASARPLALAFANALLLQDIATRAVAEERTRIARELHDDLGPSLASLGLGLDVAMIDSSVAPPLTKQLEHLRNSVSGLVTDVRQTVADLRAESQASLANRIKGQLGGALEGPELEITLEERRPPRPAVAQEVAAIATEAVRNALRHSAGSKVQVQGIVDFDEGEVRVSDNGRGFDPTFDYSGHFGLIGMRERAERAGVALEIDSSAVGTIVLIKWHPQ